MPATVPATDLDSSGGACAARAITRAILNGSELEIERGVVPPSLTSGDVGSGALDRALREIDAAARGDAPGQAPPFDLSAARWGLVQLAWLAQSLVTQRGPGTEGDDPESLEAIGDAIFSAGRPDPRSAAHAWSVDLTLRYLKDLRPQVRAFVHGDPARVHYERLVRDWPLSCPAQDRDRDVPWDHPTLACLAADRAAGRGPESLR